MSKEVPIPSQLFCQICQEAIPNDSAKRRSNTCRKPECINSLRRFRTAVMTAGKCPHCYHPSSPAEWELFRRWRQWEANQNDTTLQSFMKNTNGMTLRALARKLENALGDAFVRLKKEREDLIWSSTLRKEGQPDLSTMPDEIARQTAEMEKLLDHWLSLHDLAAELLPEKPIDAKAAD